MPIRRFRCSKCGIEGTCIGVADRSVTSVPAEEWMERCAFAAMARESGEPVDVLSVNCPHLRASAVRLDADGSVSR